jgi:hypothetical protein
MPEKQVEGVIAPIIAARQFRGMAVVCGNLTRVKSFRPEFSDDARARRRLQRDVYNDAQG